VVWSPEGHPLVDFRVKKEAAKDWRAVSADHKVITTAYSRKELLEAVKHTYKVESLENIEEYLHVDPIDHAIQIAKTSIQYVIRGTKCDQFCGAMTGKNNFRDNIATLQKYKGNRDGMPKPVYYQDLREYFQQRWSVMVIDGYEADDYLSMQCWNQPDCVLASIDKDLSMVPCEHYNQTRRESFHVTPEQGMHSFMKQLLTGDSTDNIPGLNGIGPVKAERALEGCSLLEQFQVVCDRYREAYGEEYEYQHWQAVENCSGPDAEDPSGYVMTRSWEEIMEENAQLLWMVKDTNDPLWNIEWFKELLTKIQRGEL
jgi:hypothetical protein